jgi:hypothetical protein
MVDGFTAHFHVDFCGLRIAKSRNRPAMGYCGTTAIPACRNASPKTFSHGD